MPSPTLWIVAGPNGAGKTTCTQREPIERLLAGVRFLNPDDLSREKLIRLGFAGFSDAPDEVRRSAFLESADDVFDELSRAIAAGEAVGVETVLSTFKYLTVVETVRRAGGFVGLIYVALESPALACQRGRLAFVAVATMFPPIRSRLVGNGPLTICHCLPAMRRHSGFLTTLIPTPISRLSWWHVADSANWSASPSMSSCGYDPLSLRLNSPDCRL